jgi:hypothetical protein
MLENAADAGASLLQHARFSGHDPGKVCPHEHRCNLVSRLVDVRAARQLIVRHGVMESLVKLLEPPPLNRHHTIARSTRSRRKLH